MLRVLVTADLHGDDDSPDNLRDFVLVLRDLAWLAQQNDCTAVIVAGDVFHHKAKHSRELLVATMAALEASPVPFVLLRGNHDTPDNARPEETVLTLFKGVATVVTSPVVAIEEDAVIAMLPWYPVPTFTDALKRVAVKAMDAHRERRILVSHVSLQEGHVSPSNTRVQTPVRAADLCPEVWTAGIYLGDYHAHQKFAGGMYVGAPRPRTFGDYDNVGAWVVTAAGATPVALVSRYPRYRSHRVDSLADLPLRDYDDFDRHRIYCPHEMRTHLHNLYPRAKLEAVETAGSGQSSRLAGLDRMDWRAVVTRWLRAKKLRAETYWPEIEKVMV